jgi:hypothetical protein
MSGMEVPIAMGALSGIGSYMAGGRPEQAEIAGYGGTGPGQAYMPGLAPQELFKGALGDLGRIGAAATQYAATPVSMPSSYVQPLPMFKGTPVDVFAGGVDPALPRPELLFRSGVDWGASPAGIPFSRGGAAGGQGEVAEAGKRLMWNALQQPSPAPTFGGVHEQLPEMQQALSLLRPQSDPTRGQFDQFLFTGAAGPRGLAEAFDQKGSGTLPKRQAQVYQEAGYPTSPTDT